MKELFNNQNELSANCQDHLQKSPELKELFGNQNELNELIIVLGC